MVEGRVPAACMGFEGAGASPYDSEWGCVGHGFGMSNMKASHIFICPMSRRVPSFMAIPRWPRVDWYPGRWPVMRSDRLLPIPKLRVWASIWRKSGVAS